MSKPRIFKNSQGEWGFDCCWPWFVVPDEYFVNKVRELHPDQTHWAAAHFCAKSHLMWFHGKGITA